jgi:hypothetical protein
MSGNQVPKKIFGPEKYEITSEGVKLGKKDFHNFCFSPNIVGIIKSRRKRRAENVACMREVKKPCTRPTGL